MHDQGIALLFPWLLLLVKLMALPVNLVPPTWSGPLHDCSIKRCPWPAEWISFWLFHSKPLTYHLDHLHIELYFNILGECVHKLSVALLLVKYTETIVMLYQHTLAWTVVPPHFDSHSPRWVHWIYDQSQNLQLFNAVSIHSSNALHVLVSHTTLQNHQPPVWIGLVITHE